MRVAGEDFAGVVRLYDDDLPGNNLVHDLLYPRVYGEGEYVGQFSDNSATELRQMGAAMELPPGAAVLDIGCGTAAVASFLASEFGWRITGIDVAGSPLAKARRRIAAAGQADAVRLVHGNVYEHDFGEAAFDGVYGTGAFCHFDAASLFARCRQLLRDGGRLAFLERVRTGALTEEEWHSLTTAWACPSVYSVAEYTDLLTAAGFAVDRHRDLTATFRTWQDRSVTVRHELRDQIVEATSEEYFELSTRLADHENAVTKAGKLGYALVVASARASGRGGTGRLREVVEPITPHERHVHDVARVVRSGRTALQDYAVVDLGRYGLALVLDGRLQSTAADEAHYHEALLFPAYACADRVERALVFGGANGGILPRLYALPGLREVVLVDIDSELHEITSAALPHLHRGAGDDPRCRMLFGDPRTLLEGLPGPFDLVVADLPDATAGSPAQRLFTVEFYRAVRARMTTTGVFATQAGPAHPFAAVFFASVVRTLGAVFRHATPYRLAVPSFGVPWGFVVASDAGDPATVTEQQVQSAMAAVEPQATAYDALTHRHMFALDRPLRDALAATGAVASDDRPPAVVS